ncbi:MAG: hypothetical protein WC805_00425 [Patescibacteria group bacterium]|jgi:hypothetical protein
MDYKGAIIKESLENKDVLKDIKIIDTRVEEVTKEHETPWLSQWTIHNIEVPEDKADEIAEKLSHSLDSNNGGTWYADFKNDQYHYIIYRDKVFKVDRKSKEQYDEAEQYGISIGTTPSQLINYEGEYKDAV